MYVQNYKSELKLKNMLTSAIGNAFSYKSTRIRFTIDFLWRQAKFGRTDGFQQALDLAELLLWQSGGSRFAFGKGASAQRSQNR
jgi:hypothetical protein